MLGRPLIILLQVDWRYFSRAVNTTDGSGSNNDSTTESQSNASAPFPNSYYPAASASDFFTFASFNETSPPKYPSPWMNGEGEWAEAYSKAKAFVSQLTLTEKVNLTTGTGWETQSCVGQTGSVPRLGFRSLCLQDSPVGIRFTDFNSVFPAGGTIAASFDRKLWRQRGYDMGSEHRDKGIDVQLGPVVGPLGRSPEGGRGWEGFSPDPVLSGIAAAETIKGIQSAGVMATIKHFVGNEQEHFRQVGEAQGYGYNISEALSSNIDDVTLHELYMWPFADAVRSGAASVMCAYTQVNNSYSCQNSYLLNYLLKGELGFQGFVVSDWQAQHAGVGGALAGLDLAMPGDTLFDSGSSFFGTNLTIAVLNGTFPMWRLDDMVMRIVAAWYLVGRDQTQIPINFNSWTLATNGYKYFYTEQDFGVVNEHVDVRQQHGKDIRRMAARSTVLLKNANKTLPLGSHEKFTAVFGSDSTDSDIGPNGCADRGCDNGTLGMGWGSGSANFPYLVTPLRAITNHVTDYGNGIVQSVTNDYAYDQIATLAPQASVAIVFVNSDSGEGFINVDGNEGDRQNLTLWHNGDALIANVSANCNNTIVVIHSTGPILIDSFVDNPNVTAILWAGLPGEQSGHSIVDVLYGKVNPAARLPFTLGKTRQSYGTDLLYNPNNGNNAPQDIYGEGPFIDYLSFNRRNETPIFAFGHGLSYTKFQYSDLKIKQHYPAPYKSRQRKSGPAPSFGSKAGNASEYVLPTGFPVVNYPYLYPYINSTDLKASANSTDYGQPTSDWLPEGASDGSSYEIHPAGGAPGGNPQLYDVHFTITAQITNIGDVVGDEVPQLYVSLGGPRDAIVALRGFDRLNDLQPGETRTSEANLTRRDLSNWSAKSQNWYISSHQKMIHIGKSSRKIKLSRKLPSVY
jgi:beta-glucosidase